MARAAGKEEHDRPPQPDEARRRARRDRPGGAVPRLGRVRATSTATLWSSTAACPPRTPFTARNMDATVDMTDVHRTEPDSRLSPISTQRHGDVLIVTSNNPPVNALGHAVREGLVAAIEEADGRRRGEGGGDRLPGPDLLRRRRHHRVRQADAAADAAAGGRHHRELHQAGGRRDPRHRVRRRPRSRAGEPLPGRGAVGEARRARGQARPAARRRRHAEAAARRRRRRRRWRWRRPAIRSAPRRPATSASSTG